MEESTGGCDEPANLLLHEVINQLTVIVGNCDLMSPELRKGSESAKRLGVIHEAAIKMAESLKQYQCRVWKRSESREGGNVMPLVASCLEDTGRSAAAFPSPKDYRV
jgi:hypothetical protein